MYARLTVFIKQKKIKKTFDYELVSEVYFGSSANVHVSTVEVHSNQFTILGPPVSWIAENIKQSIKQNQYTKSGFVYAAVIPKPTFCAEIINQDYFM